MVASGWGRLSGGLLWRSCRGVGSPNERRLHPTRIRTPAAADPERSGGCAEASRSSAWPDAHAFPRSRPFNSAGSSREGCPVWGGSGAGQTPIDHVPRRRSVGGGVCERGTSVSQLVRVAGLGRAHSWDRPQGHEPVSPPPSSDAAGSSFTRSHGSSPPGVFVRGRRDGIGVPSHATGCPRSVPPTHLGLRTRHGPLVSVRRHSGSRVWLPLGSGSPTPPCLSAARSGPRRTPSSSAAGGRRPGPACGRRSTAPCPTRAGSAASPGTASSARPSGR